MKDDVAWVAVRRIVRHRKSPGFANARALETGYLEWRKRAYNSRDRSAREIVVEDVIGKEPSIETNRALAEVFADLNKLVGQEKVKSAFHSILRFAQSNYKAELAGDQVRHMPMNRMFLGNPGTGKVRPPFLPCYLQPHFLVFPNRSPTFVLKEHGCWVCSATS
jgi:hypothetical protein